MPFITVNYGDWSFWRTYNPFGGYYGSTKVAFDGVNKLILVSEGTISLNVKEDIFSVWKRWMQIPGTNNSRYLAAISAVGGDPITTTEFLGATFFLENGWRIQPWAGKYVLSIVGNLYTREVNGNPVNPTQGVSVSLVRSNLVDGRIAITQEDYENIANEVWDELRVEHANEGTFGEGVASIRGDMYGSVRANVLGNIEGDILNPNNLVDEIWDEVLDSGTHNVVDSAGRRLWTTQDYGGYQSGSIWFDSNNGFGGTTDEVDGTVGRPSNNLSNAFTVAQSKNLKQFFVNKGSSVDLSTYGGSIANYRFWGNKWSLVLANKTIDSAAFETCEVTGTGVITSSLARFTDCILNNVTIGPSDFIHCYFEDDFTVGSAGSFVFDNCFSSKSESTPIVFDLGAANAATEVIFSKFNGNIQFNNIKAGDSVSIYGEGNIILDSSCDGGSITIRGNFTVTDNSATTTITDEARVDKTQISDAVWDQVLSVGTYNTVDSAGRRLRDIQDTDISTLQGSVDGVESKIDIVDSVVDSIQVDTDNIETKIDTIDTVVDAIEIDTTSIETKVDTANANIVTIDSVVDSIQLDTNAIETKIDTVDTVVDSIQLDTNSIESKVDTANTNISTINSTVNSVQTDTNNIETKVDNINTNVTNVNNNVNTVKGLVEFLYKYERGRWKIDRLTNQMTIYDTDGITPLFTFNLTDNNGDPNSDAVYERTPV